MEFPKRKPIHIKDYNYSQNGAYFVLICTQNRECLFGEIVGEGFPLPNVRLNKYGEIIEKYIIMPNHIHLIVLINNDTAIIGTGNPSPTTTQSIKSFKTLVTQQIGFANTTHN